MPGRLLGLIAALALLVDEGHAEEAVSVSLGVSALSFRYAEFPDDARLRNKETGILPGINAAVKLTPGSWRIGLAGSAHGGAVDYDGATTTFRPHQTRTDTRIFDGIASLGYEFVASERVSLTPYLDAGYRYWKRDILPNRGLGGLLEEYRWFYGAAGLELAWKKSERFRFGADVRLIRPIDAKLDVAITPATTLDLGIQTGYRVGLPFQWTLGRRFGVSLEPYYEQQDFGASLPKNGILEPASDSHIFGVHLNGRWTF